MRRMYEVQEDEDGMEFIECPFCYAYAEPFNESCHNCGAEYDGNGNAVREDI